MTTHALGLDFGTTNSVVALGGDGGAEMLEFAAPGGASAVFRSALCFWEDDEVRGGVNVEAGPWAIAEYLEYPQGSRFIQSFKSVAASASFEHASIFTKRLRFEELGKAFLDKMVAHSGGVLKDRPRRIVVGRPIEYAGSRPDEAVARARYDAMFAGFGAEVHYVYEPIGAAFSYARRLSEPATILVADFGGGTSDFSVVRIGAPGDARRCVPLGHAGIGIAGDRFDYRIIDKLVLPMLGQGTQYRSFDKLLEIPRGYFADFGDWSRLALMRNRRTLEALHKLQHNAVEPEAIGRMIAIIENELGFPLYDAVGRLKRALSSQDSATFAFTGGGVDIAADVTRAEFESWIAPDLERIEATIDRSLAVSGVEGKAIDRVFLTGGTSLIPAVRRLFDARFGADRIATGGELTSIAHGLALVAQEEDVAAWAS
ncbi:Hsp70 family protein [Sphingomonas hengshuiensis]|uniref:Molecular chaperone Hsp70 n=1 Tax=Sphingomonas hengshuiensis TaxID=1609977 RepID=A0A7U4LEX3_9SPHN|nr:Hsp70 family protein [Sphingomonas hengshuiensis]AJP71934.1 molecular chaperone Hsp70 [Sphingomonas hengshuiensis]